MHETDASSSCNQAGAARSVGSRLECGMIRAMNIDAKQQERQPEQRNQSEGETWQLFKMRKSDS